VAQFLANLWQGPPRCLVGVAVIMYASCLSSSAARRASGGDSSSTAAALCCCWWCGSIASRSWTPTSQEQAWSSSPIRHSLGCSRCCPPTAAVASHGATTARSSAGSSGSFTPAGRGGMCPGGSGPGRPAMAGCAAGRPMGPGPESGRCWPLVDTAQATTAAVRPARRCWRRCQWQRRARAWWRRRHHDHHSTWRTVGGVHHTRATSSRRASAVEILTRSELGEPGG
jgi:hypothetical protein